MIQLDDITLRRGPKSCSMALATFHCPKHEIPSSGNPLQQFRQPSRSCQGRFRRENRGFSGFPRFFPDFAL